MAHPSRNGGHTFPMGLNITQNHDIFAVNLGSGQILKLQDLKCTFQANPQPPAHGHQQKLRFPTATLKPPGMGAWPWQWDVTQKIIIHVDVVSTHAGHVYGHYGTLDVPIGGWLFGNVKDWHWRPMVSHSIFDVTDAISQARRYT